MKRDLDLIRQILLIIEDKPDYDSWAGLDIPGKSNNEISYHIMLLNEAGLIEARKMCVYDGSSDWKPSRLTWEGHEFIEASRDENIWAKAKMIVKEKSGGLTLDVLKVVLVGLIKESIGI
ncbi:MAG: hypothetical protein JM58_07135 [Peptococcaceae bacterium BICA1-8]|nr:MAG: hypothetical protein JM58_07135 [Peptococcaceae bacterium BICA1-8]